MTDWSVPPSDEAKTRYSGMIPSMEPPLIVDAPSILRALDAPLKIATIKVMDRPDSSLTTKWGVCLPARYGSVRLSRPATGYPVPADGYGTKLDAT